MTRKDFLSVLIKELKHIDPAELQDVLRYYNEYFDDAEDEQKAIEELGSPQKIAAQIRATSATRYMENSPKGGKGTMRSVLTIIGWIFAAPIALPLAIALFAVVFAAFITLFSLLFALIAVAFSLGLAGVLLIPSAIYSFIYDPLAGLFMLGAVLITISLCMLLGIPFIRLTRFCGTKFGLWISRLIHKKSNQQNPQYQAQAYQAEPYQAQPNQTQPYTNQEVKSDEK